MRCAALLLAVGCLRPLPAADKPGDPPDPPHTDIHKALLSEFRFQAAAKEPPPTAPFLARDPGASAPGPADPDLVTLAPFTVRETANMERLHADIALQRAEARTDAVTRKLGIGVHVAPMGPVGFYAVTVLYVPIGVGFGFSF